MEQTGQTEKKIRRAKKLPVAIESDELPLYCVEVQILNKYNVRASSPEDARMKVLNNEEDIPINAVISDGVLL